VSSNKKQNMKNVFILLISLVATSMMAQSSTSVDLDKSVVNWKAAKVTGEHSGNVKLISASLTMKNGILNGAEFVADMNTIKVTDLQGEYAQKLEGHLKSDDFFGVSNHPSATFKSTSINKLDNGQYEITGDLKIKGISHPITFQANVSGNKATANLKVDRTKYDIKYGSGSFFDGLGDKMIYDEFDLAVVLAL